MYRVPEGWHTYKTPVGYSVVRLELSGPAGDCVLVCNAHEGKVCPCKAAACWQLNCEAEVKSGTCDVAMDKVCFA